MNFDSRTIVIGRSHECDIVINDPDVSRKHATLTLVGGIILLRDSGSLNGVYVNGRRITEAAITASDEVRIGRTHTLPWDQIAAALYPAGHQYAGGQGDAATISIGRSSDNAIVMSDPNVSRRHASIRFEGGRYYLQDMNSRNGTFVNGQRITACEIRPGDQISLGTGNSLSWQAITGAFSQKSSPQARISFPQEQDKPGSMEAAQYQPDRPTGKKSGKSSAWIAAILLGALILAGGGFLLISGRNKAPNLNIEPILSKDAVPVPASLVLEASEGKVILSEDVDPSSYQTGKVLASGVSEGAPYGFLRRVTGHSIQNGQVEVSTAPASLDDAFDQLGLDIRTRLYPDQVASSRALTDGVVFSPNLAICAPPMISGLEARSVKATLEHDPFVFRYAIDKTLPLANGVTMNITGNLDLSLGFVLQAKLEVLKGTVYAKSGSIVKSKGNLQVVVNGEFSHKTKLELYEHDFPPVEHLVMGVPILLHPKVIVILELDANGSAAVSTSVSAEASLEAGGEYIRERWKPYSEKHFAFQYNPPSVEASWRAYISAGPRFELNLYDMAGPYAYARGFLDLNGDINADPLWTLDGGYRVDVGARLDALGKLYEYTVPDIIKHSEQLARAGGKKPAPAEPAPQPSPVEIPPTPSAPQGDPRPVFVDIINGNWNSVRQLADMFESTKENSRQDILDLVGGEPTKSGQLGHMHLSFLGVMPDLENTRIVISPGDLSISYPRQNIAEIRFTDAAIRRLAPILAWSDPLAGAYGQYPQLRSDDYDRALRNLNDSVMRSVREPKYFVLENGAWKCSLYDEMLE